VQCQPNLLLVVGTLHAPRSFTGRLHSRQEQCHQYANDGDDDKQFNQGKTPVRVSGHTFLHNERMG
jgi:hypothetical protein